ncbi:MAG: DNA/RNA non-specific endonuclease [bacterium]
MLHPWGEPVSADTGLLVLRNRAYDCGYSPALFIARWSTYLFTPVAAGRAARHSGGFRADPRLAPATGPLPADYHGLWKRDRTGFDRGHQAPDATLKAFGSKAQAETYYLSNITPQYSLFNQGFWRELETRTRSWAGKRDTVWVVTGPVFLAEHETLRVGARNLISVPHAYFQVAARKRPSSVLALLVPHVSRSMPWDSAGAFLVAVDSVEKLTGLTIFPDMNDSLTPACSLSWPGLPVLR